MMALSGQRVSYCYDLMDSAYDAPQIRRYSEQAGHVAITDINPRRNPDLKQALAAEAKAQRVAGIADHRRVRFRERSTVERGEWTGEG